MNMKKTIAAVSAAAVAVSAMATTVNALETKTYKYSLVHIEKGTAKLDEVTWVARFTTDTPQDIDMFALYTTNGIGDDTDDDEEHYTKIKSAYITAKYESGETAAANAYWNSDKGADHYKNTLYPTRGWNAGAYVRPAGAYVINEFADLKDTTTVFTVRFVVETRYTKMSEVNDGELVRFGALKNSGTRQAPVWQRIDNNTLAGNYDNAEADAANPTVIISMEEAINFVDNGDNDDKAYPMHTDQKGILVGHTGAPRTAWNDIGVYAGWNNPRIDLFEYMDYCSLTRDGGQNRNMRAVVNDAIVNYDSVQFKFNTAVGKLKAHDCDGDGEVKYTGDNTTGTGEYFCRYYDNDGQDWWIKFGQTTYPGFFAIEGTGNTGYDWAASTANYKIFGGALVVNESYTMSLADTQMFDWAETSITFDWDDVQSVMGGWANANDAAKLVRTMNLVTSVNWYWDSLELILTAGEESVEFGAGAEAEDETVPEDDIDDEDADEDESEDEPEVVNPQTGNSPIALAVVPVALAAAAIVAKKRS